MKYLICRSKFSICSSPAARDRMGTDGKVRKRSQLDDLGSQGVLFRLSAPVDPMRNKSELRRAGSVPGVRGKECNVVGVDIQPFDGMPVNYRTWLIYAYVFDRE